MIQPGSCLAAVTAATSVKIISNRNTTANTAVNVDSTKPPEPKKVDVGTVAALGVAVGAVGAFVTGLIGYATGLFRLGEWLDQRGQSAQIAFGAVALYVIVVMAPSAAAPFIYFQF